MYLCFICKFCVYICIILTDVEFVHERKILILVLIGVDDVIVVSCWLNFEMSHWINFCAAGPFWYFFGRRRLLVKFRVYSLNKLL